VEVLIEKRFLVASSVSISRDESRHITRVLHRDLDELSII
jgi:hypothetical protein